MTISLKKRLQQGETLIGGWLSIASAHVAEALASCGFDWIAADLEHSPFDETTAAAAFIAIERRHCVPFVRLPSADPYLARRMIDSGARGLIVPTVEKAAAFREFSQHCVYAPEGRRGMALTRANSWGDTFDEYLSNAAPILVPQIETRNGVASAQEIAALPEVDALFLGPYDLSADLGQPGRFDTDEFNTAMQNVKQACLDHGKAPGFHQVPPDDAALSDRIEEGYRFLAFGTDMIAMRHALNGVRQFTGPTK